MPKQKLKKTSNLELLQHLAPRTDFNKITEVADDELLAYIGGIIKDRKRLEKRRPDRTVDEWLNRNPEVIQWLKAHGSTVDDAVNADKAWNDRRKQETAVTEKYGQRKRVLLNGDRETQIEFIKKPVTFADFLSGKAGIDNLTPVELIQAEETTSGNMLSVRDLANKHEVDPKKLRTRLTRWMKTNFDHWIEVTDRKHREATYIYNEESVMHIIESLKS